MQQNYILYGRPECHLCEQAALIIAQSQAWQRHTIVNVNIDDDATTHDTYCIRIPVLRSVATGAELDWPFDLDQLKTFFAEND